MSPKSRYPPMSQARRLATTCVVRMTLRPVQEGWQDCNLSLSLCWISTVPSLAPLVWAIGGFSLALRPVPPLGVVQWACRHHIGATCRGMTRNYHSPATESAECLVERAPVYAFIVCIVVECERKCRCCPLSTLSDNRPRDRVAPPKHRRGEVM